LTLAHITYELNSDCCRFQTHLTQTTWNQLVVRLTTATACHQIPHVVEWRRYVLIFYPLFPVLGRYRICCYFLFVCAVKYFSETHNTE